MKVLFTVFTSSHGNGGHFHSLVATAKALSQVAEVGIVNIGFEISPAITTSGIQYYNVLLGKAGLRSSFKYFRRLIQNEEPDILHAFCSLSFGYVRYFAIMHPIKTIQTKCGGPNPKYYFPYAKDLILYSQENLEYFKNKHKFRRSKIHLIPNRVFQPKSDPFRCERLFEDLAIKPDETILLRIGRITNHYRNSIFQAINLLEDIKLLGPKAHLVIIGSIQDYSLYNELMSRKNQDIHLIVSDHYTQNASELIEIADFVIGTGRSLMEASGLGKILLTPNSGSKYPVLVTPDNYSKLLETNFSPRNILPVDEIEIIQSILHIIKTQKKRQELSKFSILLFNEQFNIANKVDTYIEIYNNLQLRRCTRWFDFLLHYLFISKHIHAIRKRSSR